MFTENAETIKGSDGTTLTAAETTEEPGATTLAAEKTTEWSEGTKPAGEGSEGPGRTTLVPEGTTEGPGRPTSATEGTTEVPEPDTTVTKIYKPATDVLPKSTLETEQTTLGTTQTTEPKETPGDYESTVKPISPRVTKIPRIVTTSAFTEGNRGEKARRWPKDIPLIKQITGTYNLYKQRHM